MTSRLSDAVEVAHAYAGMSPEARRAMRAIALLPQRLVDPNVRAELRDFVRVCRDASVSVIDVEQAMVVLNACDGKIGVEEEGAERVRLVGVELPAVAEAAGGE